MAKHKELRRLTRELLQEEALRAFRVRVDVHPIDDDACASIRTRWTPTGRKVAFPWEERILPTLHKSHPRRLDLALWCLGHLCGVAVVRLADCKAWLSITHIEGSPDPSHPLKSLVVPLVLAGADLYGTLIQAHDDAGRRPVVRIMNPLKESINWYASCGYSQFTQANGYSFVTAV